MTHDELAIYAAAVQIYISRETRKHGRPDSDLRFEAAEKAHMRLMAIEEASAIYHSVNQIGCATQDQVGDDSIVRVLDRNLGNVLAAAKELGITPKAVYDRMSRIAPYYFKSRKRPRRYDIPVDVRVKCEEEPA